MIATKERKNDISFYSYEESRRILKGLVRTKYDYQDVRIRTSNRLGKKKDGDDQNKKEGMESILDARSIPEIVETFDEAYRVETNIDARIGLYLGNFRVYKDFLSKVKGCGPAMSAVIISEIDIFKADTVSKLWQFSGLNPGEIFGKKRDSDGTVTTSDLVRGDRPTAGYVIPYNKFLKCKLMGVLADCMVKSRSQYCVYYYNMKQRLANSKIEYRPGRPWMSESKAHINMAAKRYMIKMFLEDLYAEWRAIEGLPVRAPYQEEYLGHRTSMEGVSV